MVNPLPPSSSSATHIHTKAPKRQGLHGCWPRVSLWTHQYKRMRSVPFSFLGKVHLFLPVLWLAFQPRQAERVTVSHLNPGLNEGKRPVQHSRVWSAGEFWGGPGAIRPVSCWVFITPACQTKEMEGRRERRKERWQRTEEISPGERDSPGMQPSLMGSLLSYLLRESVSEKPDLRKEGSWKNGMLAWVMVRKFCQVLNPQGGAVWSQPHAGLLYASNKDGSSVFGTRN